MFGVLLGDGEPQVQTVELITLLALLPVIIIGLDQGFLFIYFFLFPYSASTPLCTSGNHVYFIEKMLYSFVFLCIFINTSQSTIGMGRCGLAKHTQQWLRDLDKIRSVCVIHDNVKLICIS